jgi:hypothetical protein
MDSRRLRMPKIHNPISHIRKFAAKSPITNNNNPAKNTKAKKIIRKA